MAGEVTGAESTAEVTERRAGFARQAIADAVRQKAGNSKAHGEFTVRLHWKAGVIELVTVEDSTTYK
jgi:hypothetical protein